MQLHDPNDTFRFGAPPAEARGAVILIHGRGSSPEHISGLAKLIPAKNVAFLAPSARNGIWYPRRFFVPSDQNEPWVSSALGVVDTLVEETLAAGLSSEQIGLIGFSQGACLTLEYATLHPRRYAFVAALSGALIGPLDSPRNEVDLRDTPILVGCADHDDHIPIEYVEKSVDTLSQFNANVTRQIFPGAAHTVFPEEIEWLKARMSAWNNGSKAQK